MKYTKQKSVSIPEADWDLLRRLATERRLSISGVIRQAVKRELKAARRKGEIISDQPVGARS